MVIPTFLFFLYFYIVPFFKGFYYSFFEWSGYSQVRTFVGLDNYFRMVRDSNVWTSLSKNVILFFLITVFTFLLSLIFAVVVAQFRFRENGFWRTVFFFPYILPQVVTGLLWRYIYNPTMGLLNGFFQLVGLEEFTHSWLAEPNTVLPSLSATIIWANVGFFMVLFVTGIKNIPDSLFEAARIDGAGDFQQFAHITLPLLREIMRTQILFFVTTAISGSFAYVNIMTGQNNMSSQVITTYMYKQSFSFADFGYGTTIGMLVFVITLLLTLILRKMTKREIVTF